MKAKHLLRSFFFGVFNFFSRIIYLVFKSKRNQFNPVTPFFSFLRFFKKEFVFKKGDLVFYYDPVHTGIGWNLYLKGQFEADELVLCSAIIQESDIIADIGANIGFHCVHFAHWAPNGIVFAFEPSRFTLPYLLKNSRDYPNVIITNSALSDTNGILTFYESENDALSGLKDTERAPVRSNPQVLVQTFDHFSEMAGISRLDFVKIDVEGFELNVIKGMNDSIMRFRPVIFCEVYKGTNSNLIPDETILYLMKLGYRAFVLERNRLLPYTKHSDILHNYLFVPTEKNEIFDRLKNFGL